jgi:hypothetical protein
VPDVDDNVEKDGAMKAGSIGSQECVSARSMHFAP